MLINPTFCFCRLKYRLNCGSGNRPDGTYLATRCFRGFVHVFGFFGFHMRGRRWCNLALSAFGIHFPRWIILVRWRKPPSPFRDTRAGPRYINLSQILPWLTCQTVGPDCQRPRLCLMIMKSVPGSHQNYWCRTWCSICRRFRPVIFLMRMCHLGEMPVRLRLPGILRPRLRRPY